MEEINTNNFMLNCKQATFLYSKSLETKISVFEKIKLISHLMICKHCRRFSRQIKNIETNFQEKINTFEKKTGEQLSENQKIELKSKINSKN